MLYLSTKSKADSFTAYKVLHSAAAPDGGMFMPMQIPVQDDYALDRFERMSFGETTAAVINLFFGTKLSGWDVDFTIGRQAVELVHIGHKISVAESWHNTAGSRQYLVQRLYNLAIGNPVNTQKPNAWFCTVVNIAMLFGVYGKFCRQDVYNFDVAVDTEDLQLLLAVRYAQRMGLPVRKIVLGCMEGDGLWDFLSYGDYTAAKKERNVAFEALLWLACGYREVERYHASLEEKVTYRLNTLPLESFRKDLFGTVVGDHRVKNVMENTLKTNAYQMETEMARAFGALLNYRAKTGENRTTLMFGNNAPEV